MEPQIDQEPLPMLTLPSTPQQPAAQAEPQLPEQVKRTNRNQYKLTDMSNISKTIFEIGNAVRIKGHTAKRYNFNDLPALTKLFYATYLTGWRIGEAVCEPQPRVVEVFAYKGYNFVQVERCNEKHFVRGKREILTSNILVEDEWDAQMFQYCFDGGVNMNFSNFLNRFRGFSSNHLTLLIKRNFKANQITEDGLRTIKEAAISPHQLRHWRTYSLRVNHGHEPESVQRIMGWRDPKFVNYYSAVMKATNSIQQLVLMDKHLEYLKRTDTPKYQVTNRLKDLTS